LVFIFCAILGLLLTPLIVGLRIVGTGLKGLTLKLSLGGGILLSPFN
jgi:hypothetical protein